MTDFPAVALTVLTAFFILLFAWFIYDRELRESILMRDFNEDFEHLKKTIPNLTAGDAERMISQFEQRWDPYIDHFTLSNRTAALYRILFKKHGNAALN